MQTSGKTTIIGEVQIARDVRCSPPPNIQHAVKELNPQEVLAGLRINAVLPSLAPKSDSTVNPLRKRVSVLRMEHGRVATGTRRGKPSNPLELQIGPAYKTPPSVSFKIRPNTTTIARLAMSRDTSTEKMKGCPSSGDLGGQGESGCSLGTWVATEAGVEAPDFHGLELQRVIGPIFHGQPAARSLARKYYHLPGTSDKSVVQK